MKKKMHKKLNVPKKLSNFAPLFGHLNRSRAPVTSKNNNKTIKINNGKETN